MVDMVAHSPYVVPLVGDASQTLSQELGVGPRACEPQHHDSMDHNEAMTLPPASAWGALPQQRPASAWIYLLPLRPNRPDKFARPPRLT